MKYIKKVILENFQSHKYTVVDFNNRLNVIVGPSDSGKTAILRGVRWALYNDPSGDYFIREGETECGVTIVFSDNTKIKRYRSKSKNIYYLYDENDNELKFEGFGTSVPNEIIEATGIKKILLDKNVSKSINISDQLEGAFLLSEKTSVRASSIGYLVGVDIIDDALKETLRESRNLSNNKRNIDNNIIKLEKELSKYDYLGELNRKVSTLEDTLNKINNKDKLLKKYKEILCEIFKIEAEKTKLNIYTKQLKDLDKIEKILSNIELNNIKFKQISKQKRLLDELIFSKEENIKMLNSFKNLNTIKNNIHNISNLYNKKSKITEINSKMKMIYKEIENNRNISNKLINLNSLQKKTIKISNNLIELKELSRIKTKDNRVKKSLSIGYIYINKLKNIEKIERKYNKVKEKIKILNMLIKLSSSSNVNKNMILESNKKLEEYKNKFNTLSKEYKEILLEKETCPLCFSHIDSEKANYIISQYK